MKNPLSVDYQDGAQKLLGAFFQSKTQSNKSIIVFPAFEGRSEFSLEYGAKLADEGFNVFVADMYGDAKTADTIEGCFALIKPFLSDRSLVRRRALLAYEACKQQAVHQHIGAIGFCFGGMCMLELARSGADLYAGVSLHGVLAKSDLSTEKIKAKLLVLHGYQDPQVPPSQLNLFADEMEKAGVKDWVFTFFGNAKHSFTDPKTGTFDAEKEKEMGREYDRFAAEISFANAVEFLGVDS